MIPFFLNFALPTIPAAPPAGTVWGPMFSAYQRAFERSNQELWTSSARIVQEHATRAWVEASQSCMAALAENAAAIQQRAFANMIGAQQKAAATAITEMTDTLTGN